MAKHANVMTVELESRTVEALPNLRACYGSLVDIYAGKKNSRKKLETMLKTLGETIRTVPYWRTLMYQRQYPEVRWLAVAILSMADGIICASTNKNTRQLLRKTLLDKINRTYPGKGKLEPCWWLLWEADLFMTCWPHLELYCASRTKTFARHGKEVYQSYSGELNEARQIVAQEHMPKLPTTRPAATEEVSSEMRVPGQPVVQQTPIRVRRQTPRPAPTPRPEDVPAQIDPYEVLSIRIGKLADLVDRLNDVLQNGLDVVSQASPREPASSTMAVPGRPAATITCGND